MKEGQIQDQQKERERERGASSAGEDTHRQTSGNGGTGGSRRLSGGQSRVYNNNSNINSNNSINSNDSNDGGVRGGEKESQKLNDKEKEKRGGNIRSGGSGDIKSERGENSHPNSHPSSSQMPIERAGSSLGSTSAFGSSGQSLTPSGK